MGELVIPDILGELVGIVKSVPESLWRDVVLNNRSRSTQEEFNLWIEGKDARIISLDNQIDYQSSAIRDHIRENEALKNLLIQKDKEIKLLKEQLK
jgi:hypothetical protein